VNHRLERLSDLWRDRVATAVSWLQKRGFDGRVGLILGSGLGDFVETVNESIAFDYGDIPGFTATSVAEHAGRLVCGEVAGVKVVIMQGRLHPYEGLPFHELLFPTAVFACLGVQTVVVTNAAGGLNRFFNPGDLMVIRDQLDLHLKDPLRGLLTSAGEGQRGHTTRVFDENLARQLVTAGAEVFVPLHSGTYASVWGPAYETKAEIGWLKRAGCDAVGMSTAPETVLLAALDVAVVGLSCITNPALETRHPELSHQDVVEVGRIAGGPIARLLSAFLPRL
jgi:purine-nucleoside phosphorylase